ncbi:nadF-like NAD kinase [Encephalitozoon intestinalis ATCC 50506]|uniref:NadF-like NAD kinase n=1 Tax=Encephalitozoon intestinalis (strain ATCC 50506) TaxID=876142 RepID=E0S829_ENCIT|nr:nadF-like NAD kinase [Encephalitozoon intestinalis ATCC 50506]ADM11864.1 nadF-like NAD kinase [Encephalitozoon intestinalis ATCC 50506]UTX45619.1 NAD kinase [Encephalitozoon intestinalis]
MGRFLLVTKNDVNEELIERVKSSLDCDVYDHGINYDGIIVIGGDGTVLRAIAPYRDPPVVYAINRGKVGFLCPISYSSVDELIARLRGNGEIKFMETKRLCLQPKHYFLNEAIIKPSSLGLGTFKIFIDDTMIELRGDAVIVSTRIGSSAYNASLNGPLLLDEGIVINVVAPNRCNFKPIVCRMGTRIRVEIDRDPQIILDGIVCEEKSFDVCYDGSSVRFGYLNHYDRQKQIEELFLL